MAEVKNAFIKSKMNKDLDARLIPQGEYRDAVNIQVSKSEGDDVGALENVLGNFIVATIEPSVSNLTCIGYFVNDFNNTVYLFFTDYTDNYSGGISTYNPSASNFIYSYNADSNNTIKLVEGAFLNFSKNRPITGVNVLENFLFFTDNRNQPRKINVNLANQFGQPTYYVNEDQISVAKYFPFEPIEVIKETDTTGVYETTMKDAFSEYIPINESGGSNQENPYWAGEDLAGNPLFPGDPQYLEDKFPRFSYRFKFEDGEYSLIAPFTQVCFIPKQDGYFLQGDEQQTTASTIVEFMENKVNEIALQIPMPIKIDGSRASISEINSLFKISELDIIYKESDSLALQVVETIPVNSISSTQSTVYEYVYNSTKPFKTLPENEITRVYDKVPVRSLSQEVISNRVVYGNFQDKHTPPTGINYQVAVSPKFDVEDGDPWAKTNIEYPNHTVKQNRNYQVGVVLSDRYGRQSTVILSNTNNVVEGTFGADTVYLPYSISNAYDSSAFLGNSLKILFNDFIQSEKSENTGQPGLYDGNASNDSYRPTGWHSYKIVVKQLEQDYYNVYTSGAIKGNPFWSGDPGSNNPENQNASYITLLNDNINKVPRDLSEVGPQDKQFRSSVELFGLVENTSISYSGIGNRQYFPGRKSFTTNTIEDLFDLFDTVDFIGNTNDSVPITNPNNPYYSFFRSESNPFVAEFITSQSPADQFGLINIGYTSPIPIYEKFENLNIFETKPVVSRLDIFWESATSGLLSTLNIAIGEDTNGAFGTINFNYNHFEADGLNTVIVEDFSFVDVTNGIIEPPDLISADLISVYDALDPNDNRVNEFILEPGSIPGTFNIKTNAYFYYGINANQLESYTFTFSVVTQDLEGNQFTSTPTGTGVLTNNPPIIQNDNSNNINVNRGARVIFAIDALNGSNINGGRSTDDLVYEIVSQESPSEQGAPNFIVENNQVINTNPSAENISSFVLRATDVNGEEGSKSVDKEFTVFFGKAIVDEVFDLRESTFDGGGLAIWFTDSFSSLTGNEGSIFTGNFGSTWLNGYQAPSTNNNPLTNNICPAPSNAPSFTNDKLGSGLTQGVFFVILQVINTEDADQFDPSTNVNLRYNIAYRANENENWSSANDLNNESTAVDNGVKSGTWTFFNGQNKNGWDLLTNNTYGNQNGLLNVNQETTASPFNTAARVFAFSNIGEYRIIMGNLQSNFGVYQGGSVSCGIEPTISASAQVLVNDFYNPKDLLISPDYNDFPSIYRYEVVLANGQTPCNEDFTGTYYYAQEPFANYVTQLYTDNDLRNTPLNFTAGVYKIRRMLRVESSVNNNIYNPELTKDGAYTASFSSEGQRNFNSIPQPCLY